MGWDGLGQDRWARLGWARGAGRQGLESFQAGARRNRAQAEPDQAGEPGWSRAGLGWARPGCVRLGLARARVRQAGLG